MKLKQLDMEWRHLINGVALKSRLPHSSTASNRDATGGYFTGKPASCWTVGYQGLTNEAIPAARNREAVCRRAKYC